jgi:hypothetical protein
VTVYNALSSTETALSWILIRMRSGWPSPLTSAVVTQVGKFPETNFCWMVKLAVVAPEVVELISTETWLPPPSATITSGRPSPLTSAAVTQEGLSAATAKVCWVAKLGVVAPRAVVLSSTEIVLST